MTESTVSNSSLDLYPSGELRGRRSIFFNSSYSSSAHFSTAAAGDADASFSPPTPRHFAVPFSWEHRPDIPKSPKATSASTMGGGRLPLPPLFRSHSDLSSRYGRCRSHGRLEIPAADPFAVALRNCAKGLAVAGGEGGGMRDAWDEAAKARRRSGFGLSRFYGSCKAASSVAGTEPGFQHWEDQK